MDINDKKNDTGKVDLTADDIDSLLNTEGQDIEDEDDAADFASGFGVTDDDEFADDDADDADDDADDGGKDDDDPAGDGGDDGGDDPGRAPSPDQEEESDIVKELRTKLRQAEGTSGTWKSRYLDATKKDVAAKTKDAGGDVPTADRIKAAMADGEKFVALQKEFPEWGEAMSEAINTASKGILDSMPQPEQIAQQVEAMVETKMGMLRLAEKHEGWEDTVKSSEFIEFAYQDGPNTEERGTYFSLLRTEDARSSPYFEALIEKYPLWGSKFGALLNSDKPNDSIKLLDQFKQSRTAQQSDQNTGKNTDKKDRLERSTAATHGTRRSERTKASTEEDEFESAFKGSRAG